jgi:hypothetical protein
MRAAAFVAACAALGLFLGYVTLGALIDVLYEAQDPVQVLSGRDAADFVADVETYLRAEGY